MPAVATGANAANGDLIMIGVSGDGDSLSIGLGQLCHAIRRNVNMLYVLENNGVYGLTKGQFSASADKGSTAKKGEANAMEPIDGVLLALTLGATFVARSFSGDKNQLVPIIQAGIAHKGFAFVDVISPCVTFNDHEGSTKSYALHARARGRSGARRLRAAARSDRDRLRRRQRCRASRCTTAASSSCARSPRTTTPTDRDAAYARDPRSPAQGRGDDRPALHLAGFEGRARSERNGRRRRSINLPHDQLCPGNDALQKLMGQFR